MAKRRLRTAPAEPEPAPPRGGIPWGSVAIALALVAVVLLVGVGMTAAVQPAPTSGPLAKCRTAAEIQPRVYAGPPPMCINPNKPYNAVIHTTKGDVTVVLLVGKAPKTINNFVALAVNGYYDGLSFWRVEDWVVQTGDPTGTGRGGPGYTIPDEPGANDPWVPGSLGYARTPEGLNGGQFFITKQAWPGGDPQIPYNHFATVTLGFDVVQQLTSSDRITRIEVKQG